MVCTEHGDLAYIFDPEAFASSVAKTTAKCLFQLKAVLGRYDYTIIMHIAGDRNCWASSLRGLRHSCRKVVRSPWMTRALLAPG